MWWLTGAANGAAAAPAAAVGGPVRQQGAGQGSGSVCAGGEKKGPGGKIRFEHPRHPQGTGALPPPISLPPLPVASPDKPSPALAIASGMCRHLHHQCLRKVMETSWPCLWCRRWRSCMPTRISSVKLARNRCAPSSTRSRRALKPWTSERLFASRNLSSTRSMWSTCLVQQQL